MGGDCEKKCTKKCPKTAFQCHGACSGLKSKSGANKVLKGGFGLAKREKSLSLCLSGWKVGLNQKFDHKEWEGKDPKTSWSVNLSKDLGHVKFSGNYSSCGKETGSLDFGKVYNLLGYDIQLCQQGWFNQKDSTYGWTNNWQVCLENMGGGLAQSIGPDGNKLFLKGWMKHGDFFTEEVLTFKERGLKILNYKCNLGYAPCSKAGAWISVSADKLNPKHLDTTFSVLYAVNKQMNWAGSFRLNKRQPSWETGVKYTDGTRVSKAKVCSKFDIHLSTTQSHGEKLKSSYSLTVPLSKLRGVQDIFDKSKGYQLALPFGCKWSYAE